MSNATSESPSRVADALLGLAAALLLLGLALGRFDAARRNRISRPLRMLSSALVLLCALLRWKGAGPRSGPAARLIAGGMGCGLVGDLVMARVIALPKPIVWGMLSFGAGHVLYIRAFLERGAATPRRPYAALGAAWALAGWWALARRPAPGATASARLRYAALAYALLLGSMSGMAAALAARDRRYLPTALGGALFLASDTLLASELFRAARFPGIGDVIWLTYIAGQALIVRAQE